MHLVLLLLLSPAGGARGVHELGQLCLMLGNGVNASVGLPKPLVLW